MKRVVVTGMGALTPIGNTLPDFLKSLENGVGGAAPITKFDASKFKTQFACELKDFDPQAFIPKSEAKMFDPMETKSWQIMVIPCQQESPIEFPYGKQILHDIANTKRHAIYANLRTRSDPDVSKTVNKMGRIS